MTFTIERRNFLHKLGWSVLAVGSTSILAQFPLNAQSLPANHVLRPVSSKKGEAERWLLATGKQEVDDSLYAVVVEQISP